MKTGPNIEINKDKLPEPVKARDVKQDDASMKNTDKQPIKEHPMAQDDNSRMLAKKHGDDKLAITLLIVGTGLIAYHFW